MNLPWISHRAHRELVAVLSSQIAELKEERKLFLDRLAVLGFGGPLYSPPSEDEEERAADVDPDQELLDQFLRLRHRPAKLADALTRHARREHGKHTPGAKVAWIPQMDKVRTALDHAEEVGIRVGSENKR